MSTSDFWRAVIAGFFATYVMTIGILFEMCTMIAKSGRRSDAGFG